MATDDDDALKCFISQTFGVLLVLLSGARFLGKIVRL